MDPKVSIFWMYLALRIKIMRPELTELIKKYEKDSIPGNEHVKKALSDFAEHCCKCLPYDPDIYCILDYFEDVYKVGFNKGYEAGKNSEQELNKVEIDIKKD